MDGWTIPPNDVGENYHSYKAVQKKKKRLQIHGITLRTGTLTNISGKHGIYNHWLIAYSLFEDLAADRPAAMTGLEPGMGD